MESPLISVVTITFNNLTGLKKTVNNYKNLITSNSELIVIDGGSTDGSEKYLTTIKSLSNDSIKTISEKDNGIYDAMNKGVQLARGEWIVFMNSGDTFSENSILISLDYLLQNNQTAAFYGDTKIEYSEFSRIQKAFTGNYWKSLPFIHQSFYCKRELLLAHPFNTNYKICADYDFYLWLVSQNKQIKNIEMILSCVSSGGKSDINRTRASLEKLKIYRSYTKHVSLSKLFYFYMEFFKGLFVRIIKLIFPKFLVKLLTKFKYRVS